MIGFSPQIQEARQQSRRKEKALEAGRLYFKFLTEPELNVAHQVFREMDQNGDGRVHSNEVIDFLIREGWSPREAQKTFDDSGLMRNTDLTLEDAVAFWYVMMSMPSCDSCSDTLVGLYYTCPACFHDSDKNTYDLCPGCYSKYGNEHGILVDSHALLQNLRNQEGSRASSSTGTQGGVTNKRRSLRKKSISMVTEEAVKAAVREGVNMGINAAAQGACSIM